ncbi:MAG: helix-turn-helix domain-containing protein [Lachnospiraceae bacterium]|nr:helix-turn-helix domain-containing protein [Lachnospiraceae bacterium]
MIDKIMECITNPVKCKLLLEIYSQKQITAKHLSDILGDIPQATLYRNLKKMLNDGILKVVDETQIRGTVERTYALAFNLDSDFEAILTENSGTLYMQVFMQFFLGFAKQFQQYCKLPNINIKEDMSGFSLSHLYLSDEELTELIKNISSIIKNTEKNKLKTERKLRTLGIIVSPPEN